MWIGDSEWARDVKIAGGQKDAVVAVMEAAWAGQHRLALWADPATATAVCNLLRAKIHAEPRLWRHSLAGRATRLWAYGLPWTSSPTVLLIAKSCLTL